MMNELQLCIAIIYLYAHTSFLILHHFVFTYPPI